MSAKQYVDLPGITVYDEEIKDYIEDRKPELTYAQYQALPSSKLTDGKEYYITDITSIGADIDDNTTAVDSTWSSTKINNINKTTTLSVDLTGWTQDTSSQSGTTLYKKQISLNNVYVECPTVDIGANGSTLPTSAQQDSYNLIQYATVDDSVPCIYLYASAIPTTAFYIKVKGVD